MAAKFHKNIFTTIALGLPTNITSTTIMAARQWFRETAQKITSVNLSHLFEQNAKNLVNDINITSIGSMFTFHYDPKWKDKLPYYDAVPLIFVVELYSDGFLGINLHYLSPYHRAKLMDALYTITLKEKDMMKVQISYSVLKSASKFRLFKPCLKRYLSSHIQSRLLFIEPEKWDMVLMLPTQRFVKASEDQIYRDSAGIR